MSPQETQFPDSRDVQGAWAEAAKPVPIPFSLQTYLEDQNGLERCMAGVTEQSPHNGSQEHHAVGQVEQVVQLDTCCHAPVLVAGMPTDAGFSDSDFIEVDYDELVGGPGCSPNDGLEAIVNEVVSLNSSVSISSGTRPASTWPSCNESPAHPAQHSPSVSPRYAALHRQLEEAGLTGLGDGTDGTELYPR
jgi:hypothetical protein